MVITSRIRIDFASRTAAPERVEAVQDDKYSRNVAVSLFANNVVWNPPNGASVIIHYRKQDNTCGHYDTMPDGSVAYSITGNTVLVKLAPQVCTVAGPVNVAVTLIYNGVELSTFPFIVNVHEQPGAGFISEDYIAATGILTSKGWGANKYLVTDSQGNVTEQDLFYLIDVSDTLVINFATSNVTTVDLTAAVNVDKLLEACDNDRLIQIKCSAGGMPVVVSLNSRMDYTAEAVSRLVFAGVAPNPYYNSYAHFELFVSYQDGSISVHVQYQANPMAAVVKSVNNVVPDPETGNVAFAVGEGGAAIALDKTLTQEGQAAEAAATGAAIKTAQDAASAAASAAATAQNTANDAATAASNAQTTANDALQAAQNVTPGASADQVNQINQNTENIEKNTTKIAAFPIVSDGEYTDIAGLRQVTAGAVVRSGNTITITTTLQGGRTSTTVITLDDDEWPTTITTDGVEAVWTWEGV